MVLETRWKQTEQLVNDSYNTSPRIGIDFRGHRQLEEDKASSVDLIMRLVLPAQTLVFETNPRSTLFQLHQRTAEILRVKEEHRPSMGAYLRFSIA